MDDSDADQRLEHRLTPNAPASLEALAALGVLHFKFSGDEEDPEMLKLRDSRGYSYKDVVNIHPDTLPDYERKLKSFFEEHIHTDEEIRYVLEGSGYFDVRDKEERWIRILMHKGDLIILPAGIYHRFTLDEHNYIKACRLFVGEPVWTPYNRCEATDVMDARKGYVSHFIAADGAATAAAAASS